MRLGERVEEWLEWLGLRHARQGEPATLIKLSPEELAAAKAAERREEQIAFVRGIREFKQNSGFSRSHVYILSLADYRAAIHHKWDRVVDKVDQLTRMVIRKHSDKQCLFAQADDETYVMAMPTLDRHQAHERIARMAIDLTGFLVGAQPVNGQRPVVVTANCEAAQLIVGDDTIDLLALRDIVERARAIITQPGDTEPALTNLLQDAERNILRLPPEEVKAAELSAEWERIKFQKKQFREWNCFRVEPQGGSALEEQESGLPFTDQTKLSVLWRPCWVDETGLVSSYLARMLRQDGPDCLPLEGNVIYPFGSIEGMMTIDRSIIAAGVQLLHANQLDKGPISLVLPLCIQSLQRTTRWQMVSAIAELPATVRTKRLKIELSRLPDGITDEELRDIVDFIQGNLGCVAMVRLRPTKRAMALIEKTNATMVGVDLSELRPEEQMGDLDLLANLEYFRQMAS